MRGRPSKQEQLPEKIKSEMIAEAHAIIHVRGIVLVDTKVLEAYLEAFREE